MPDIGMVGHSFDMKCVCVTGLLAFDSVLSHPGQTSGSCFSIIVKQERRNYGDSNSPGIPGIEVCGPGHGGSESFLCHAIRLLLLSCMG